MNNDLISRSALIERYGEPCRSFLDVIESMPAVDAAPVRHERMTNPTFNGVKPVCTGCHIAYDKDPHWNYCPYCGAKMDGDVNA